MDRAEAAESRRVARSAWARDDSLPPIDDALGSADDVDEDELRLWSPSGDVLVEHPGYPERTGDPPPAVRDEAAEAAAERANAAALAQLARERGITSADARC
jgi:hypothetical protein